MLQVDVGDEEDGMEEEERIEWRGHLGGGACGVAG